MVMRSFGSGTLWGTNTSLANSTPRRFGTLQDVSLEFNRTNKSVYGSGQFPEAVGAGQSTIKGKAKMGQIQPLLMLDLHFGILSSTGQFPTVNGEAGAVPASSVYTVTVANSVNFTTDLGVKNVTSGLPFKKVVSAPAAGQYSVAAGVYTFAAADAGTPVLIDYVYSLAGSGGNVTIANPQQGIQPVFSVVLETAYTGPTGLKKTTFTVNACISEKLDFPTKMADFMVQSFDFEGFADNAGNVASFSFPELT